MKSTFYIQFNVKTPEGFYTYGRFSIGDSREAAAKIFHQLKGHPDVSELNFLTMELMETVNNLPVNLKMLSCTLDDLSYNCRVISREVFNLVNLK